MHTTNPSVDITPGLLHVDGAQIIGFRRLPLFPPPDFTALADYITCGASQAELTAIASVAQLVQARAEIGDRWTAFVPAFIEHLDQLPTPVLETVVDYATGIPRAAWETAIGDFADDLAAAGPVPFLICHLVATHVMCRWTRFRSTHLTLSHPGRRRWAVAGTYLGDVARVMAAAHHDSTGLGAGLAAIELPDLIVTTAFDLLALTTVEGHR